MDALGLIELVWNCDLVLPGHSRVFPFLSRFGSIPQRLPIPGPAKVLRGHRRGQDDFPVFNAVLACVVKDLATSQIGNLLTGTIGRRPSSRAARGTPDGLDRQMIDGHL